LAIGNSYVITGTQSRPTTAGQSQVPSGRASFSSVIPAQAGIQGGETMLITLDARFRGHDDKNIPVGQSPHAIVLSSMRCTCSQSKTRRGK
jgi:hypothetical protein